MPDIRLPLHGQPVLVWIERILLPALALVERERDQALARTLETAKRYALLAGGN